MKPLLLRGGRVIDPASAIDGTFDVLVIDGEIEAVEPSGMLASVTEANVVDCSGLWVTPGLIDPHVHLRDPGFPQKETIPSGLRAAAAGGFTTVAAMANTSPVNDRPGVARYMLEQASLVCGARLVPVSAVTKGLHGRELVDFDAMAAAGARLFSDDGIPIDDQGVLSRACDESARVGFSLSLHEEDRALTDRGAMNGGEVSKRLGVKGIPVSAETRRVARDLAIAIGSEAPVHIAHVSAAESVSIIASARRKSANITCEVTPHHFTLDDSAVEAWGPNARMAPPLRGRDDLEAVRAAIGDGLIDMIATDHAPHDPDSKRMSQLGALFDGKHRARRLRQAEAEALVDGANGIVGLETAVGLTLALVHCGLITPLRMIEMMAVNPARLLRLDDAGTLAPRARGDITVIDPDIPWEVDPAKFLSMSRNTPFGGTALRGMAIMTIVGGEVVFDGGRPGSES